MVSYCCVTNLTKLGGLKNNHLLFFTFHGWSADLSWDWYSSCICLFGIGWAVLILWGWLAGLGWPCLGHRVFPLCGPSFSSRQSFQREGKCVPRPLAYPWEGHIVSSTLFFWSKPVTRPAFNQGWGSRVHPFPCGASGLHGCITKDSRRGGELGPM